MVRVASYLLVWLVLPLVLAEALLRGFEPELHTQPLYTIDYDLGWKMRPHAQQLFQKEGRARVRSNSLGFRDGEYSREKPADTLRIALLGDSFFEAKQVNFEHTIAGRMPSLIAQCVQAEHASVAQVEVLNFAIQGWGTIQQYLAYTTLVHSFNPDMVILGFYEGNDVFDNHPKLNPSNPELAPYLAPVADRNAVDAESPLEFYRPISTIERALRRVLLNAAQYSVLAKRLLSLLEQVRSRERLLTEAEYEWTLLRSPLRVELEEAWSDTELVLQALHARVEQDGREFLFASIPSAIAVHPDAQQRAAFKKRYGVQDLRYAFHRLEALFAAEEILDLGQILKERTKQNAKAVYGFSNNRPGYGHWNKEGHRAAAEALSERVCAKFSSGK